MYTIRPKTYNEILRFKRCVQLKTYVPEMDGELLKRVYDFIGENPNNRILISKGMISFMRGTEQVADNIAIGEAGTESQNYTLITLTPAILNISRPFDSLGDSSGGSSGNNNNNNNNNNNG